MSKKSKKQRAKARKAQERRESGIVLRAVTAPPSAGGKLIELKPAAKNATAVAAPQPDVSEAEPSSAPEAPAAREEAAPADVAPRNAIAPAKLGPADAEPAPDVEASKEPKESREPARAPLEEHRSSRRVSVAVDIHLSSDSHFFSGLSGDISEGGLFFSTYRPLTVGTEVDVEFSLPGTERAVHARGEVRWIREHSPEQPRGVGIAFEELSDEDRDAIHAFCSARPPLYYEDVG